MKINGPFTEKILTGFIRTELAKFHFEQGIVGISGGLDSSVTAALTAAALKPNKVIGLIMPYGETFPEDVEDAHSLAEHLQIRTHVIDIAPSVDAFYSRYPTEDRILIGNKMARERMSVLYDFSVREKALIIGTSNKTELLLGYGTLHGDMACAINPIGDLYKTQVRALGRHLGLPAKILKKTPTAGLWAGQTDEAELGLTYDEIDKILFQVVDLRKAPEDVIASGLPADSVNQVIDMIKNSEFKRKMPPIAKISMRTVGHDFLYPYDRGR